MAWSVGPMSCPESRVFSLSIILFSQNCLFPSLLSWRAAGSDQNYLLSCSHQEGAPLPRLSKKDAFLGSTWVSLWSLHQWSLKGKAMCSLDYTNALYQSWHGGLSWEWLIVIGWVRVHPGSEWIPETAFLWQMAEELNGCWTVRYNINPNIKI